jgi:hypothetical protein
MNPVNKDATFRLENTIFQTNGRKMVAESEKGVAP